LRCYMRDPDGYMIEVGQTTITTGPPGLVRVTNRRGWLHTERAAIDGFANTRRWCVRSRLEHVSGHGGRSGFKHLAFGGSRGCLGTTSVTGGHNTKALSKPRAAGTLSGTR